MIRLYPLTTNPTVLERLAGVVAGTAARYEELYAKFKSEKAKLNDEYKTADKKRKKELERAHSDLDEQEFTEMRADENVGRYRQFTIFGWGRFNDFREYCPGYSGELKDLNKVRELLDENSITVLNNVTMEELEGVSWH